MDGVAVEPGHTYIVSVFNLPEPEIGDYRVRTQIAIPGELPPESSIESALKSSNTFSVFDIYYKCTNNVTS